MAENVVVRCKLRLDPRHRDKPPQAQIHSLRHPRHIEIDIFKRRIEPILAMIVQPLAAEIPLREGVAIVGPVKRGQVIAPIEMLPLHRVRQPLRIEHELVHLETIGIDIVGLRGVAGRRSAEIQRRIDPAIDLRPVFGSIDGRHQRIAVPIRLPDHRRTAVRPVGIRKRRRIQRRRQPAPRRGWRRSRGLRPVLPVEVRPAGKKTLVCRGLAGLGLRTLGSFWQRLLCPAFQPWEKNHPGKKRGGEKPPTTRTKL